VISKLLNGRTGVLVATFFAAFISVPISAAAFVFQYAIGGTGTFDLSTVFTAMIAVHVLIGLGEAIITALTVSAVLSLRPDLVFGARGKLKSSLKLNTTGSQE
jgi:cobalt/nickel transport system permease protein